jgi:hypothetical protein
MAEEFLTEKMIDEYKSFKPKLNWGTKSKGHELYSVEKYYSVEDVKRNYLVRTSLDNNQLVVETDDIQAEDTIEWNLTIQAPVLAGDKKAKSVRISGDLGIIYYSFSNDDINTSSNINFGSFTTQSRWWYELKDNKYEFDPIFVVGTSGETSGKVTIYDNHSLTLEFKCTDDSILTYFSNNMLISSRNKKILITPTTPVIDPPSGGGGDDDGEIIYGDVYLRYAFSSLNGIYYSPSFNGVFHNDIDDKTTASFSKFTSVLLPNELAYNSDSIDLFLGRMNTKQLVYLWNGISHCGVAYKDLSSPSVSNTVWLDNGLSSSSATGKTPSYDSTKQRYVITLYITASSSGVDVPKT